MPLAVSQAAISWPLLWAHMRYNMGSSTTGLASSGVLVVAWRPPFGSKHTTPPLRASGHRPTASTASKRTATKCHTASGHCLIRLVCHPSCPAALAMLIIQMRLDNSRPVKGRGLHPSVALGGLTLAQFGSSHQASSLAIKSAFWPAHKPFSRTMIPVDCKPAGPCRTHLNRALMPPLAWARTHCRQLALRAALLLSLTSSSSARHLSTSSSSSAADGLDSTKAAQQGSLSSAMAFFSCRSWLRHSSLPCKSTHCWTLLFLREACPSSSDKASPV